MGKARRYQTSQVHYLHADINYQLTSGTQYLLGTIPANAKVIGTTIGITTAFNAGTTNVIIVGTSGDDDALVDASGVAEGSVAVTRVAPATLGGLMSASAETNLYVKYTQSGTAASAGAGWVCVEFVLDNDVTTTV